MPDPIAPNTEPSDDPVPGFEQNVPEVSVATGEVPLGDLGAIFTTPDGKTVTPDFQVKGRFESDKHIYMMGLTSPGGFLGQNAAFVQLAVPTLLWIADWTALRVGAQPPIPNAYLNYAPDDGNWVLLDEWYEPGFTEVIADGQTPSYRISGTFVYGNIRPNDVPALNIAWGRPAYLEDQLIRRVSLTLLRQGFLSAIR